MTPEEARRAAVWEFGSVEQISHDFWRRGFGADPAVIGKTFRNQQEGVRLVIGVMPKGFWVTPWTSDIDYWRAKSNFKPFSTEGEQSP